MKSFLFLVSFATSGLLVYAAPSHVECHLESETEKVDINFDAIEPQLTHVLHENSAGRWKETSRKDLLDSESVCGFPYSPNLDCSKRFEESDNYGIYNALWTWTCGRGALRLELQLIRMGELDSTILAKCYDKEQIKEAVSANNCQWARE